MNVFKILFFSFLLVVCFSCDSNEDKELIEGLQEVNIRLQEEIKALEERNKSLLLKCEKLLEECRNENK